MKRIKILVMAALGVVMTFSSCEKMDEIMGDGDSGDLSAYINQRKTPAPETISVREIARELVDSTWTTHVGKFNEKNELKGDTLVTRRLAYPKVSIYPMETTYVDEAKMTSETFGPNGTEEGEYNDEGIASVVQTYVHNLDVKKNMELAISYEIGRLEIWGLVVESPEINVSLAYSEKSIVLASDGSDSNYKYYIGTMTYDLTINGQSEKVTGRQRIAVANTPGPGPGPEPEPEEEITEEVIDAGYTWLNPTTWLSWAEIRRISSKTGTTTSMKQVNCNNGIYAPGEDEKIVAAFDVTSKKMAVGAEVKIGSRPSGDFTISTFNRPVTTGSENVDKAYTLMYEKPVLRLQKGNSYVEYELPYPEYEEIQDKKFTSSDLSDQKIGEKTYERKLYKYAIAASFIGYAASASSNAILKVVKEEPEPEPEPEPRVTPSWLGYPEWAKYTRVQRVAGAKFEDMIVFGYTNGVVMAPGGKVDLEKGVFAYTDALAAEHGVEKCAKGACYSGVWDGGKWIPAKILESDGRWLYTGLGKLHTVMENNAINLGIGKDVTHTPKKQHYELSENGTKITIHYSRNNASLSETDLLPLK